MTPAAPQPAPKVRDWGLGPVWFGLGMMLLLSTIVSIVFMIVTIGRLLSDGTNLATLTTEQLTATLTSSPVLILAALIAGWVGFGSAFAWAAVVVPGNFWVAITARIKPVDLAFGVGLAAILLGLQAVLQLAASAVGMDASEGDNTGFLRGQTPAWTIVLAFSAAVVAPIVEELFFRGLFLHALLKRSLRQPSNTVVYAQASPPFHRLGSRHHVRRVRRVRRVASQRGHFRFRCWREHGWRASRHLLFLSAHKPSIRRTGTAVGRAAETPGE